MTVAGYSGTPLAAKLGIKGGMHVALLHAPRELQQWLAPLPAGVVFDAEPGVHSDVVHLFATRLAALHAELAALRSTLRADAVLWVSWPKQAAGTDTDITEDRIRDAALPLGFVDVKVCAVSAVWSGLKLVVRKALR